MTYLKTKHIPERSCCVCRVKSDKHKLIRIVKSPDGLAVIDIAGKLPGRGAYICPDDECITRAEKSGALNRALGMSVQSELWPSLREYAHGMTVDAGMKIRSILGLARKSGVLLVGADNIERCRHVVIVLYASDSSDRVKEFALSREHVALDMNIAELSRVIGSRGGVQIVGLPVVSGFAKKLKRLEITERGNAFE